MSKQNKFFAAATTAALVASAIVPVASAAEFKDANQIAPWAAEAVQTLAAKDIIGGNPDGSFNPKGNVTRAEAAKMFKVALDLPVQGTESFTDVKDGQWFQDVIIAVSNAGIVDGMGNGLFVPNGKLTRAEAAKMIVKAYGFEGEADLSKFADADKVAGKWFEAPLSTAVAAGIIAGKGNLLAANDSITRQEFAVMLTRAIDTAQEANTEELLAAVEKATTALDTAVKALNTEVKAEEVDAAKAEVKTAKEAVTALEKAVADAKDVITTEASAKATTAIETAKKAIATTEAAIELTLADPQVLAVEAINAKEIKVTFNKAVKDTTVVASAFTVTKNNGTAVEISSAADAISVAKDGRSATIVLASALTNNDVLKVVVAKDVILTSSYDKFEGATFSEIKFTDTVAPKLLSSTVTSATTIELTYDEPVDWTNGGISVNGGAKTAPAVNVKAGNYTYEFTVSALNTGNNTVQIINAADFSTNNEALITTTVNYAADTTVAEVASIEAKGTNTFLLTLNKAVSTTGSTLTVKKGNYTFATTDQTIQYADKDGVALTGTPAESKYLLVTVDTNNTDASNPLFGTSETSAALTVAFSGYKAGSTLGKEYTGSVTLSKDQTAPVITSTKLVTVDKVAKTITVPFNENISVVGTKADVTVMNGSVKAPITSVSESGKNLIIELTEAIEDATYSVVLNKGLVKDSSNNVNEAISFTKDVTTAVTTKQLSNIFSTGFTNNKNVISVAYGVKVSDAAALASSYTLNGVALPEGTVVYFNDSTKTSVTIELPNSYNVAINNLNATVTLKANTVTVAANGADYGKVVSSSTTEVKAIEEIEALNDNVAPTISKVEYVKNDAGLATGLKVTFSENVDDSTLKTSFVVKQGSTVIPTTLAGVTSIDKTNDRVLTLQFTDVTVSPSGVVLSTNTATDTLTLTDLSGNNKLAAVSGITAQ